MSHTAEQLNPGQSDRRWRARSICIVSWLLLLGLLPATASAEEETHVFNATLSLTGDCTKNTFDPVADPGCPAVHAPKEFAKNAGVAVDRYGNRYVASAGEDIEGKGGRIDIFDSSGEFITGISPITLREYNVSIAVDSQGNLYVSNGTNLDTTQSVIRYAPIGTYDPAAGEIEYGASVAVPGPAGGGFGGPLLPIAVNPVNDHLIVCSSN